jgi:hypothetical protein
MDCVVRRFVDMNASSHNYRRLPGGRLLSIGTRPSLWLGSDHLLALERTIGSERYRRFYFRDIEAIIVRQTGRRGLFNFICFTLAVISAVPAIQVGADSRTALVASGAVVALWLALALVNTARGASCDTRIRTAVQIEPLPSLGRVRAFEKTLAQIRPLIEETQGVLAREEMLSADLSNVPSTAAHFTRAGETPLSAAPAARGLHGALFSILIVSGIVSLAEGTSPTEVSMVLDVLLSFVAVILLVFALRLQAGGNFNRGVKRVTWGVLGFFMTGIAVGFVYGFLYAIRHQGQQPTDPLFFRSEPGFAVVQLTGGTLGLLLGLAGLYFLFKKERSRASALSEPPVTPASS